MSTCLLFLSILVLLLLLVFLTFKVEDRALLFSRLNKYQAEIAAEKLGVGVVQ
jgi:hypothetical protein